MPAWCLKTCPLCSQDCMSSWYSCTGCIHASSHTGYSAHVSRPTGGAQPSPSPPLYESPAAKTNVYCFLGKLSFWWQSNNHYVRLLRSKFHGYRQSGTMSKSCLNMGMSNVNFSPVWAGGIRLAAKSLRTSCFDWCLLKSLTESVRVTSVAVCQAKLTKWLD